MPSKRGVSSNIVLVSGSLVLYTSPAPFATVVAQMYNPVALFRKRKPFLSSVPINSHKVFSSVVLSPHLSEAPAVGFVL